MPPPIPKTQKSKRRLWIVLAVVVLFVVVSGYIAVRSLLSSGLTKGPDNMFGDQHLKTAVALIELHKVRYGQYPRTLRDLKFTGQWDQIALQSVDYYSGTDSKSYYIEVRRGWVGKPDLHLPREFWQGTGFSESLNPKSNAQVPNTKAP